MKNLDGSGILMDLSTGNLKGEEIITTEKLISDMEGIFLDEMARIKMNQQTRVYVVQSYKPVKDGTPGGLFFGSTTLCPGKVGDEYFMTRGHFHENLDTSEFYWCIAGKGVLIFMDMDRKVRTENMKPGSLHYIPGKVAHRVVNTGENNLLFNACWPSDAGHDYDAIGDLGFSVRLKENGNKPELITG